ncbi:hypothetical protein [Ruegeria sp. ANG10]|uniref:hypothetical protein n=1 Tax=Ruegeria sp. ANG10 TaxID=3042467 RepID=UPI003456FCA4
MLDWKQRQDSIDLLKNAMKLTNGAHVHGPICAETFWFQYLMFSGVGTRERVKSIRF